MQEGPPHVLSVATHHFVKKGDWDVVVIKKGERTHAEVFSFGRCAALRDLFVQRLLVGALDGDDSSLARLLWPCTEDLRYMLSGPMPLLPPGMLMELMKAVQHKVVGGALSLFVGEKALWANLRAALGH